MLGKKLYEALYPPDHERFPRGRKPWKALTFADAERYEEAAVSIAVAAIDVIGAELNGRDPGEVLEPRDVGSYLEALVLYIEEHGDLPE